MTSTTLPALPPARRLPAVGKPVPTATYRLQLGADLTLDDAAARVPYYAGLGVSHLYLSPILQAAPGSTHGYDVVDHSTVSDVLGGGEALERLADAAHAAGLGLVVDLVPNHMGVPTPVWHNRQLWSVLELGPDSPYAEWFDVDWTAGNGAFLMPVLGDRIGAVLGRGELSLDTADVPGGPRPVLRYFDHVFPVRAGTEHLPLAELVERQYYRLAYWRVADEELNYRRFFDVGTLAAVRVELPEVFWPTHALIVDLVTRGVIDGLRIDHVDGLADPSRYLDMLSDATDGAWIVVEKILAPDEPLPLELRAAGSTGYETAWRLLDLFTDPSGERPLGGLMRRVTGDSVEDFSGIVTAAKAEMVDGPLYAEVARLAALAADICRTDVRLRDHTERVLRECLVALLIASDRYRYYAWPDGRTSPTTLAALQHTLEVARATLPADRQDTMDVLVDLLLGREVGSAGQRNSAQREELVVRFQQTCGAIQAKGVEDTAFYRWTYLLSECEVGGAPEVFSLSPSVLHAWNESIAATMPFTLISLTTHDNKRSADTRVALTVGTEFAAEFAALEDDLRAATASARPPEMDGRIEHVLWQTLTATWGATGAISSDRLATFLVKAMREAKTYTTWTDANAVYEDAVLAFAAMVRGDDRVSDLIGAYRATIADALAVTTLALQAVWLTMPGIPDIYQGTEVVRPMLVDPDNRTPVAAPPLADSPLSGRKLALTTAVLGLRKRRPDAFASVHAGYRALGTTTGNAFCFVRTAEGEPAVVTVATRLSRELARLGGWGTHSVSLPAGRWRDVVTGTMIDGGDQPLTSVLGTAPAVVLERVDDDVWAPGRRRVQLDVDGDLTDLRPDGHWWRGPNLPDGTRYAFRLDDGEALPDPRSPRQPDGILGPSQAFDAAAFAWTDADFPGVDGRGAFTYELHVGTFTNGGTFDTAAERLGYLADLGVQMIELLPVIPSPGTRGWGYDGVDPYAVWEQYGGPAGLQRFINTAHSYGMGVCLDIVLNHLGPTGNYLEQFSPYLRAESTIWGRGFNFDGEGSDEVRAYVLDLLERWFVDFHADALRLDAVHAIVDTSPVHILQAIADRTRAVADRLGKPLTLAAESDENDVDLTLGRGIDIHWADDVHHAIHAALTSERQGYYVDFGDLPVLAKALTGAFVHAGDYSTFRGRDWGTEPPGDTPREAFLVAASNHDQVGNRAVGDRPANVLTPADLAIEAALVMFSGFTPMVFQGEEWAASTPFTFFTDHEDPLIAAATSAGRAAEFSGHGWEDLVPDPQAESTFTSAILRWDERRHGDHARILDWYRTCARLRREFPHLCHGRLDDTTCAWGDDWFTMTRAGFVLAAAMVPGEVPLPGVATVVAAWQPVDVVAQTARFAAPGVALLALA